MPFEGIYCFDRGVVRFAIFPAGVPGPRVLADISEGALAGIFQVRGDENSLLRGCSINFNIIAAAAIQKWNRNPSDQIRLDAADFSS